MDFLKRDDGRRFLRWALAVGLILRLAILWQTSALDTRIVDEQQYRQIATSIVDGHGFGWGPDRPTSIRPPLYPGMLAAVWTLAPQNLQAVRTLQIVLALATTGVVYLLGARVFNARTARYAAAVCWLYPSLMFFNFLILTETLFTCLLLLFVLLAVMLVQSPRPATAFGCGVALGLAALTRSILWPLPLVLCPLLVLLIRAPIGRRILLPGLLLAGYVVVVAPWAVRNTRLQQVFTVVDTMGGMNLRMGNYEHTPDDRMWDAVALSGEQSWVRGIESDLPGVVITEGRKDKWAQRKAIEYMRAHPLETLRRSLIKFSDLWGLEREFIAGVDGGLFRPPRWFHLAASAAILLSYVLIAAIGGMGLWLVAPRDWRLHVLLLLPIVLIVVGHSIVFGHSRYHVPLVPILGLYACELATVPRLSLRPMIRPSWVAAGATVVVFLAIWIRQIVLVDSARIAGLLHRVG